MSKNWIIAILCIVCSGVLFLWGYSFYHQSHFDPPEPIYVHDTITLTNTIKDTVIIEKVKYKTKHDTVVTRDIVIADSSYQIKDTISFDIEHKEAKFNISKDSLNIEGNILYHGYSAGIDTIMLNYDFKYTPPVQKQRKFHISLQAGYYTGYNFVNGGIYSGLGAGIGISYDLW